MLRLKDLQFLYDQHCYRCGTQGCNGMFDIEGRRGCPHYLLAVRTHNSLDKKRTCNLDANTNYDQAIAILRTKLEFY